MSRDDFYASPLGAAYSAYMERPWVSGRISPLVWGGDTKPYYASMAAAGEVPPGGTIVDCPCGAGPAMRAIPAGVSYVGVDLSPSMLRRARRRAVGRGLADFELVEADAAAIPCRPTSPTCSSPSGACTHAEIESWLTGAALDLTSTACSGPFLFFEARGRG